MKQKFLLFLLASLFSFSVLAGNQNGKIMDAPQDFPIEVSVYPNPSHGQFQISMESWEVTQVQVKVINLIGKTVFEQSVDSNYTLTVDLSNQPKGVYFVQFQVQQESYMKRVVIR